jgi:hypothetical protein
VKKTKSSTFKDQESGELNGCSARTEQPEQDISEKPSETEETLGDQAKKSKYIVLPIRF